MNKSNDNIKLKVNAVQRLLELIEGVNKDIQNSQSIDSQLLVQQYLYLKKDYTQQLLDILSEYKLPVTLID
jgi:hypothetical protein